MGNPATFFFQTLSVVLSDVILAGDNAVLIAMAVKALPPAQRRIGIAAGAGGAVVLRIILTFFAARLLSLSFLMLVGGILILWIAVKLLAEESGDAEGTHSAHTLRQAIWLILVADITMSVDNILAVAATSKGNLTLLILGLGLSITLVVFSSSMLSNIMDRYPVIVWIGAAILGRVGGDMILHDPWVVATLHPSEIVGYAAQAISAGGVLLAGRIISRKKSARRNV